MIIYIASSWKNQHAVEMFTELLRLRGHEVLCFVENTFGSLGGAPGKPFPYDEWVISEAAEACFNYDVAAAEIADLVVYIGPSGVDAWAEVGIAYGLGTPVIGLWTKGEPVGIARKAVSYWVSNFRELLDFVDKYEK